MVEQLKPKGELFWSFVGFGLMWFLCCSGISVARATNYQIELMEYKLAVGGALSSVEKVSDTLEFSAETSAIAPRSKREIKQLVKKSDRDLQAIEQDIDSQTERLFKSNIEE